MEKLWTILLTYVILLYPQSAISADWSYEGEKGAHKWPEQFRRCSGRQQSPINVDTENTEFDASLSKVHVQMPEDAVGRMILIHNGHTLQVNTIGDYDVYGGGLPSRYRMAQFHLHWGKHNNKGSEHQLDGQAFPMELHVLAYDYINYLNIGEAIRRPMGLVLLGTLFTISDDDNPALEPLIAGVLEVKDPDEKDTTEILTLNLRALLPHSTSRYYRYNGSLTTPQCQESVIWTVFEEKQSISKRQLSILRNILKPSDMHPHNGHGKHKLLHREKIVDNFRPVQPINGRTVYRSFPRKGEIPTAALKTKHATWTYKGDKGPDQWKAIYPDAGCDGALQSPINIAEHNTKYDETLTEVEIRAPAPATNPTMTVLNNGHTIKVRVDEDTGEYLVVGGGLPAGNRYKAAQLHFHWGGEDNKGSEHHVNGHAYPIELHIVTWDAGNYAAITDAIKEPQGLAVLGVLFEIAHEDNVALQPIMDVMERVADPELDEKIQIDGLDLQQLLPPDTGRYFRYNGSLTTPGCFESVIWTVFKTPQKLSHKQLREFREILKYQDDAGDDHKVLDDEHSTSGGSAGHDKISIGKLLRERLVDNFRPIQPLNDRTVLRSYKKIETKKRKSGHGHHWGYKGHKGPQHWPNLEERCRGTQQSPINIVTSDTEYNPDLIDFTFYDSKEAVTKMSVGNNGHTVKVSMDEGVHYVYGGGLPSTYQTVQLHFHWGSADLHGSEHTLDGQSFPLELHVVNYDSGKYSSIIEAIDKPEGLAVLGALFYISKDDNVALQPILDSLTHVTDPDVISKRPIEPITIESLMPDDTSKFYRYNGSLTTPGCFESVVWTVFEEKLPISQEQMEKFREVLLPKEEDDEHSTDGTDTSHDNPSDPNTNGHSKPMGSDTTSGHATPGEITNTGRSTRLNMVDNFRPVQPLNGRKVWRSFKFSGKKRTKSHWGYEGEEGPKQWAKMYPDKNCNGRQQSPININRNETKFDKNLRDVNIWFDPPLPGSKMVVKNNGHTVQVDLKGKYFITGAGLTKVYKTVQFHFHWGGPDSDKMGSEHTVDNEAYPLELHIVNYDSETYTSIVDAMKMPMGLAVFGVFYQLSPHDNPILQTLIDALDQVEDPNESMEVELKPMSVKYFLPQDRTRYYRYNGSLTTPGCYESVIWTLFEQPQSISRKQLKKFWEMFQMDYSESHSGPSYTSGANKHKSHRGKASDSDAVMVEDPETHRKPAHKERKRIRTNFRPVQPLNDRSVYRSFEDLSSQSVGQVASSTLCGGTNNVVSYFSLKALLLLTFFIKLFPHL